MKIALAGLALAFVCAFSTPCGLDIDGHGSTGDETMTVALESDATLRTLPAYGYRPDGRGWTWGMHSAPLFAIVYAPFVNAAPPLRRIETARLVSRVLGAGVLFLLTIAAVQLVWRVPLSRATFAAAAGVIALLAVTFLNSASFRFIASFARVDMLGLFVVAATAAAASWVLLAPSALRVFVLALLCCASVWTAGPALPLVTLLGLAALALASLRGASVASVFGAATAAVALFGGASLLLGRGLLTGPLASAASTVVFHPRGSTLTPSQLAALSRHEWSWLLGGGLVGAAACAGVAARRGWSLKDAQRVGVIVVASCVVAFLYRWTVIALSAVPIRFTYDVMITTSFGFLELMLCCAIAGDRREWRAIMATAIAAGVFFLTVQPAAARPSPGLLCREDAELASRRFWPASRLLVGIYNPFDDAAQPANAARRRNVDAVRRFLIDQGARSAIAMDPLFAALSDDELTFYFLNDSGAPLPTPVAEEKLLTAVVEPHSIRFMVSTPFGEAEELERAGFGGLRACLRRRQSSCEFSSKRIELTPVFSTPAAAGEYRYADEASTPMTIYKFETFQR